MTSLARGRYVLVDRIATGGMGEVWRGRDTMLERDVAIKLLRPDLAGDQVFRARFTTEARNAAALHDAHIVTLFDYGDEPDPSGRHTTYLVMELVAGVSLAELIRGPMKAASAAEVVAQAAEGLAVAHAAGIVHRDVKPANFLVTGGSPATATTASTPGTVKVTDFGIARAKGASSLTDTGAVMGTPHYVAPEVAAGREATPASDLYSLGVVLYECLSGVRPFGGDSPVAIALAHVRDEPQPLPQTVPASLRALVTSALAKDPAQRPPSAAAFARSLRSFEHETQAAPPGAAAGAASTQVLASPPASAPPVRRSRWWPLAAALAALLVIGGVAVALTRGDDTNGGTAGTPSGGSNRASNASGRQGQPGNATRSPSGPPTTTAAPSTTAASTTAASTTAPTTTAPSTTASSSTQAAIDIDPVAYIGMDAKEAEKQLKELGLKVKKQDTEGDGEPDTVADIAPTGAVPANTEVTLFVWKQPKGKTTNEED